MKKRTTDLFRFATLRAPELITPSKKKIGFIEHPLPNDSHFLSLINPEEDLNTRRSAVIAAIGSFSDPFTNVSEVKNLDLALWEFSQWLLSEKNRLDLALIIEKAPTALLIDSTSLLTLWDNFLYDVLVKKNPYVRQACIQMIVAYNFVKTYNEYLAELNNDDTDIPKLEKQAKDLKRLANAKILIREEFATSKNLDFLANLSSSNNSDLQEQVHENFISQLPISDLQHIFGQLAYVESEHVVSTKFNFETELATFKSASATAVENYLSENPEIVQKIVVKEKTTFLEKKESISLDQDTETFQSDTLSSIENLIPESIVPDFNFVPKVPLSPSFLASLRTQVPELSNFLTTNKLLEKPIEEVRGLIEKEITKKKGLQSQFIRKSVKEILINGAVVKKKDFASLDFALSYHSIDLNGNTTTCDPNSIYLSLNAGYKSAFVEEISYKMTIKGIEYESSEFKVIPNKGNQLFLKLFIDEEIETIAEDSIFIFEASFKLSNGNSYKIYKKGITSNNILSGIAIPLYNAGAPVELYGVNKIGVADYRRVEQELCCYIPGEVSHIENVMAREYKEKSTRNFISTSTTVDSVTEREAETTNDTVSTTRNELSTEISDVIQKDKASNVGLNASVNGDFGTYGFDVGANANFTNSTSTSNSDSIARTYAEDVTKRAVERIVQKVSMRRTSTILKEYEENNKHGFDNRKGTQHVTGVYRWIDKVYKNRIVNYHKRLMYEFMIPEPARFYKEAIIMKANEELASSTLNGSTGEHNTAIKPIHPSEYGLTKFDDVSRTDYATIASHYGISVSQPKEEFISIPAPISASIGNGDKDESRTFPAVTIDPDYECVTISGNLSYNVKAKVKSWGYFKFNIPSQTLSYVDLSGEYSASLNVTRNYSPGIKTSVTFSAGTKKITGYNGNFSLKCRWAESAFKIWQQEVYDDIMAEYNRQLQLYNDAKTAAEQELAEQQAISKEKETTLPQNPKYNSQIVRTELKRLCIEMLTKPFGIQQGRDFYQNGSCDVPELILGPELDKYASNVVFFENAFDWDILSQVFYPYYWAKKCDWVSLFQGQASDDYIFQAFLQSGMSRVILPVKPGFEDAVVYFMETGEVWNGLGIALNTDDELFVSIVDEMTQPSGVVEGEEWETIIPTDLTILQAKSVLLDEEGLPCCHTDEDVLAELTLKADENILTWEE